jgi:hypothetical protein
MIDNAQQEIGKADLEVSLIASVQDRLIDYRNNKVNTTKDGVGILA